MFARMTRTAASSDSTIRAAAAPRLSASRPTAPDPAYRSRTRVAARVPVNDSSVENKPSRARSAVGRVPRPAGTASRRPRAAPAMIRVTASG